MNVIVTGFEWHGDLVPFVVRALRQLGETPAVVSTNPDLAVRHRARGLGIVGGIPLVGPAVARRWLSTLERRTVVEVAEQFRGAVARVHPDVVLSVLCWGETLTPEVLRGASGARRIGWLMDDPFGYELSRLQDLLGAYDDLYSVDDGWSDNIELMTGRRPIWLPCGADPESQRRVDSSRLHPELADHIVYVGSSCAGHPTGVMRRALIESLKGLPVAIFGDPAWKEAGAFAASCYRGGPVTTERANLIYASGAIALNFHHPQFRRGTSLRTFALCAAGAFQLADWREGLDRWLTPGVDLETFRTPDELRSLAERYLADAPGRRRIADAGQRRVLTEHTYAHRLATMLHREVAPCA